VKPSWRNAIKDSALPLVVFVMTVAAHVVWLGLFPERNEIQSAWAALPPDGPAFWWPRYVEAQDYWLGYSFGLSLAFAAVALRRYFRNRQKAAGKFAVGGLTLSGVLAVAGCYLVGCCGSPMLVVWLNLFGAEFLPFAKPVMALITTVTITGAWWWMYRKSCSKDVRTSHAAQ